MLQRDWHWIGLDWTGLDCDPRVTLTLTWIVCVSPVRGKFRGSSESVVAPFSDGFSFVPSRDVFLSSSIPSCSISLQYVVHYYQRVCVEGE
jgi:hypothetical protein